MIEPFNPPGKDLTADDLADRKFLGTRARLVRLWPYVGFVCLLLPVLLFLWLQDRAPQMVRPGLVMEQIRSGSLETASVQLLASMLPIVILMLFGLMLALLGLITLNLRNERRYLTIIGKLQREKARHQAKAFTAGMSSPD